MKNVLAAETGQYLALDLGGTNYRVLLVTLEGHGKPPHISETVYAIPKDIMVGTGEAVRSAIMICLTNDFHTSYYIDVTICNNIILSFCICMFFIFPLSSLITSPRHWKISLRNCKSTKYIFPLASPFPSPASRKVLT